ncbi:MAG: hypothetical protein PHZ25_01705 [Candidatus Pacebacteria bacterium]|jgi:hypothetical protein|nr:hypothetical protein [Candidatus Paceibacterota bacterium]
MKTKDRNIKEIEGATLRTLRKVGAPQTYEDGSIRVPVKWRNETEPLELGSWVKPKNTDIIRIEISVPSGENLGDFFGRVLGGLK